MEKISGLVLFSRIAAPCIKGKQRIRVITPDEVEHFNSLIRNNRAPTVYFLKKCFKSAVEKYFESCTNDGFHNDFSYESVLNHWRYHHNQEGGCSAIETKITFLGVNSVGVTLNDKLYKITNPYHLELRIGSTVLIHIERIAAVL